MPNPETAQQDGFAAEQVDAPQAILGLRDECQSRGAVRAGVVRPVMLGQHATHDIFIDVEAEGVRDLLGDLQRAELGIAPLHLDDCRNEFGNRPR